MRRSPGCRGRASITSGIIRRARRMPICATARKASTISCAPISTTRAPSGAATSPSSSQHSRPKSSPRCRATISWISTRGWPRPWRRTCPRKTRSRLCAWLPDDELAVYAAEYARIGFQGGLNWYRCRTEDVDTAESSSFSRASDDRRALALYRGQARLGLRPGPREHRKDATERLHAHARLPYRGWRRPLGAAAATCEGERDHRRVPAAMNRALSSIAQGEIFTYVAGLNSPQRPG